MAKLEIKNVGFSYDGGTDVLDNINLSVEAGELVCVLGTSGCGKSTLFNIISGLNKPDRGSVSLDGEDITGKAGKISYMLQKDLLLPYRTIEFNAALPLIIKGENKKSAIKKVQPLFGRFGLEGTQKKYPAELSGGMRQRAALLRTYMFSDNVALLDEPFSALDTLTRGDIHRWYISMMEEINLTTIFVTHDIDEAILLSDRICIMRGKPGTFTDEIVIEKKRPRPADFNLTEEFLGYKRLILEKLR